MFSFGLFYYIWNYVRTHVTWVLNSVFVVALYVFFLHSELDLTIGGISTQTLSLTDHR